MFLDFYHMREQPFGVTPDPRFLYQSPTHREALASLYCAVEAGRGFAALIAPPGTGKTTLLLQLLERIRKCAYTAFLFQTQCNSREFLGYLLADMGIESHDDDVVRMHKEFNEALIRLKHADMRFVLVIDEAQNLGDEVLETVRLLSDFETPSSKLIQIVLSGQPQLADKLAGASLLQFRQRIAVLSRLEPLGAAETIRYIEHRLRVAGHAGRPPFTAEALAAIAARSGGIPRNINNLCFNALSLSCALGRKKVDVEIVLDAARDLDVEALAGQRSAAAQDEELGTVLQAQAATGLGGHRGLRRRRLRAASLAASLILVSLFLFHSVRGVIGTRLTNAFSADPLPSPPPPAPTNVVEVKPGQTLRQISLCYFGRYDGNLVAKIRALNPRITDPNHIETGQRIVLPERGRVSAGTCSEGPADAQTTTTARN
jgi:general secretion pathway protein A